MSIFEIQKAQIQGRLDTVNAAIAAKQQELANLQAEKVKVQKDFADLRAAYLAWKGTSL